MVNFIQTKNSNTVKKQKNKLNTLRSFEENIITGTTLNLKRLLQLK